jgi:hypothetical protein
MNTVNNATAVASFSIMLDNYTVSVIKNFYTATQQMWKNMYDNHVILIRNRFEINVLDKNNKMTSYYDLAKKIKSNEIRLPEWFLLSAGSRLQKIIPCYDTDFDNMGILLMDLFSVRGKTMMVYHVSTTSTRNGMHVSDIMTRNVLRAFGNASSLNYIRTYWSGYIMESLKLHIRSKEEGVYFIAPDKVETNLNTDPEKLKLATKYILYQKITGNFVNNLLYQYIESYKDSWKIIQLHNYHIKKMMIEKLKNNN